MEKTLKKRIYCFDLLKVISILIVFMHHIMMDLYVVHPMHNLKILDISDNGQEIGRTCFRYSTVWLFFRCMYNNLIENYDRLTSVLEILGLME